MSDLQNDPRLNQRMEVSLDELPVMRKTVSAVDRLRQAQMNPPPPQQQPAPSTPTTQPAPEPYANAQTAPHQPQAPNHGPPPVVGDDTVPTRPNQEPPPVQPDDSPRVQDRINKLYRQRQEAREDVQRLESMLTEQSRRLDAILAASQRTPQREPNQGSYSSFGSSQDSHPPAGDSVSRAELQQMLAAERQAFAAQAALTSAHSAARAEAVRDFPDLVNNQQLQQTAERIFQSEPAFRQDPMGPYKAAALARGMLYGSAPQGGPAQAGADVRKAAMSVGPSIAEGSGQPTREQAYHAALARATQTQDPSDWATVWRIKNHPTG